MHQLLQGFVQESGYQATCHLVGKRAHLLSKVGVCCHSQLQTTLTLCCDLQIVQTILDTLQPAVDNVVPEDLWKYFGNGMHN